MLYKMSLQSSTVVKGWLRPRHSLYLSSSYHSSSFTTLISRLAGAQGIEPRSIVLETIVLPLHHTPISGAHVNNNVGQLSKNRRITILKRGIINVAFTPHSIERLLPLCVKVEATLKREASDVAGITIYQPFHPLVGTTRVERAYTCSQNKWVTVTLRPDMMEALV